MVAVLEYSPAIGVGMDVGVVGRDVGVGMDVDDAVVPPLVLRSVLTDSRADVDLDRLIPPAGTFVGRVLVLCPSPIIPDLMVDEDAIGREAAARSDGLSERNLSLARLSRSLIGEGESSRISTHPLVSPGVVGSRRLSASMSTLCRFVRCSRSSGELFREEVELADRVEAMLERFTDGTGAGGVGSAVGRPTTLPMRSLGTRV